MILHENKPYLEKEANIVIDHHNHIAMILIISYTIVIKICWLFLNARCSISILLDYVI
jgi:hypothetical protein